MLVLSRKTGEQIRIGQDIVLTVVAVKGKRVRIRIKVPSRRSILRKDVGWPAAEREQFLEAPASGLSR